MVTVSLLPIVVYWSACFTCHYLGLDSTTATKSSVSLRDTVRRVLQLHALQLLTFIPLELGLVTDRVYGWSVTHIMLGIIVIDTLEYWIHRVYHAIPALYSLHKTHHAMIIPWSFGALYNSWGEAVLTGGIITNVFVLLGFSVEEYCYVLCLANVATVMDHVQFFDSLKNRHHRLHHELHPNRNFQQPFFTFWDDLFHTRAQ